MRHGTRTSTYVMLGIAGLGLAMALAFGINPGFVLLLAICPLMMFFMMQFMGGMGGRRGPQRSPPRWPRRASRVARPLR